MLLFTQAELHEMATNFDRFARREEKKAVRFGGRSYRLSGFEGRQAPRKGYSKGWFQVTLPPDAWRELRARAARAGAPSMTFYVCRALGLPTNGHKLRVRRGN